MSKELLLFSIFTFITVILWTIFEAYHVYKTSTVPVSLREQIEPLNPTLPKDVIESLKTRYSLDSLPTPVASASFTPTPTLKVASPSARP